MQKFLDYIHIENNIGGNQDWLPEWDMHMGGCAAVTACDVCIYLAAKNNSRNIYPFDCKNLTREDFIKFAKIMKPYLTPRYHGIDFLETYICGLIDYWRDVKFHDYKIEGLSGIVNYELACDTIISQLNNNLPVPFLLLRHQDPKFDDLEWHWFILGGYEFKHDFKHENFFVEIITYGEAYMVNFRELWNTGQQRKGGIIRIFQ